MKVFKINEITNDEIAKLNPTLVIIENGAYKIYEQGDELPVLKDSLKAAKNMAYSMLSQKKWDVINSGMEFDGIHIATDATGRETIMGAKIAMDDDPEFQPTWKTDAVNEDGTAVRISIPRETIKAISNAMAKRQNAIFLIEADKEAEIAKCKTELEVYTWIEEQLNIGW